jgi:hypothetical protein
LELFAWHDARAQPASPNKATLAHEVSLLEAAEHLTQVNPERMVDWAENRIAVFHTAARWRSLEPLLLRLCSVVETIHGTNNIEHATTIENLGYVYQEMGRNTEKLFVEVRR